MSVAIRGVSLTTRDARISFILRAILRERCGPTRNGTNNQGNVCSLGEGMACGEMNGSVCRHMPESKVLL